jgi:hypothetical protein
MSSLVRFSFIVYGRGFQSVVPRTPGNLEIQICESDLRKTECKILEGKQHSVS